MAKRANPFLEDYVQQRKIHVGIKQFNNNKERLQDVYDKTMQLLFDGAKKPTVHVVPNVVNSGLIAQKADRKLKQLSIGKNGALLHDTVVVGRVGWQQCDEGCLCSPRVRSDVECGRCAYCERTVCDECGSRCGHCGAQHCTRCSLSGSDGDIVCVSCYQ